MINIILEPDIRYIEWDTFGETVIHPIAILFTLTMCILILKVHRRYAVIPVLLVALFITSLQRIVIFGFDFNMVRIIILSGLVRIIVRQEYHLIKFNSIDKLFMLWILIRTITYTVLWGTIGAFVNRLGAAYTALGCYFIFRILIHDTEDVRIILRTLAISSIALAFAMSVEQFSGRNMFSIFGGVSEVTRLRDGLLRSQGAFSHPILAGSYGASLLPLMWGLWHQKDSDRIVALFGITSAVIITLTSASSGPFVSFAAGILAVFMWKFRNSIKAILMGLCLGLIVLSIIMKGPIWSLVNKLKLISASTAYHRFLLIDQAIKRFNEWYLLGTKSNAHWGWGLQDVTNGYIREGIDGGIIPLALFIMLIFFFFRNTIVLTSTSDDENVARLIWSVGAAFFTHTVSLLGVSYFGQMSIFLHINFAVMSSLVSYLVLNNYIIGSTKRRNLVIK